MQSSMIFALYRLEFLSLVWRVKSSIINSCSKKTGKALVFFQETVQNTQEKFVQLIK